MSGARNTAASGGELTPAAVRAALAVGEAVLVLVTGARGSTPREAGAAMLVAPGALLGTIGGGRAEHEALAVARALLDGAGERREVEVPLGPASDQCCGGRLSLAFARLGPGDLERLGAAGDIVLWPGGPVYRQPARPRQVNVHGAGHVGRALVATLSPLPFRLRWIDSRLDGFRDATVPAGCQTITVPIPEAAVADAEADAFHVVLTHSHAADLEIVEALLRRDFGFLGLIGSATKRALFRRRLTERGLSPEAIRRVTCPIGIAGIADKRPAVIAAAVAAQLLALDQQPAAAPALEDAR